MKHKLPVLVAATLAIGLATSLPASAATSGSTATTFVLTGGALNITVPATAALGNGLAGATLTSALGPVTVTDLRGALLGGWTASVTSTDFTTGGGTAAETVTKNLVSYQAGAPTSTTGVGLFVAGQLTPTPLTSSATAMTASATIGNTSAVWNPSISVAIPASAVVGTYAGTLTHSVA